MDRKVSFETSVPKGIYVYNLSYPLSFAGLPFFVSAILEGEPGNARVVILNIEENAFFFESDLAPVDSAANRLSAHAILPLLVLPETRGQASSHVEPEGKLSRSSSRFS
jgi:hypothetical protein